MTVFLLLTSLLAVPGSSDEEGRKEGDREGNNGENRGRGDEDRPDTNETAPRNESRGKDSGDDDERPDVEEADDEDEEEGEEDDDEDDEEEDEDAEDDDEDERNEASGHGPRRPGRLNESDGNVTGRWITFRFTENPCRVESLALGDTVLIESIDLGGGCETRGRGSVLELEGAQGRIAVHDAPNALVHLEAQDDGSLQLQLATGATVSQDDGTFELTVGNRTARLHDHDDEALTWDNGTSFVLEDGRAKFWAHPQPRDARQEPTRVKAAVQEGIERRHVAAEIDVLVADGKVSHEVLSYDNVTVQVSKKNESTFRILLEANLTEGRVFALNLAPAAFNHDRVGVRYFDLDADGVADEVSIEKADGLDDILAIDAGESPEYWIVKDEAGTHVLVAVPHWSPHMFEVTGLPPEIVPIVTYGIVLGLGFVALAAIGMFLGRRQRPMPA